MNDLTTTADIELVMHCFYEKALQDPTIGIFFTEIAKIDLETHLPHLIDFWKLTVFHEGNYRKNVLQIHLDLHKKLPLQKVHFDRWLRLFTETVDEHFEGINASNIKTKALSIATVLQLKMN